MIPAVSVDYRQVLNYLVDKLCPRRHEICPTCCQELKSK